MIESDRDCPPRALFEDLAGELPSGKRHRARAILLAAEFAPCAGCVTGSVQGASLRTAGRSRQWPKLAFPFFPSAGDARLGPGVLKRSKIVGVPFVFGHGLRPGGIGGRPIT